MQHFPFHLDIPLCKNHRSRVQKTSKHYCVIFAGTLGLFCLTSPVFAQNLPSGVEAARQRTTEVQQPFQQQSLPLGVNTNDLSAYTPGDLDLGVQVIMKRKEEEQPFRFFADVAGFYTDNVALTDKNHQGDSYLFADVGFTFEKHIASEVSVEATVRQGFFRYGSFSSLDFEDFNAGTGITWQASKLWNLAFFGRYNFERFTHGNLSSDFFTNNTLTVGVQKTFIYNQYNYSYVGYSSVFGWATPSYSQRDEHGLFGGIHYNFNRNIYVELYDRAALFNYDIGRTDFNNTVVATVGYIFNDRARVTASFSYVTDTSNHSVYNYDALTTGGGVALQLKF